MRRRWQTRDGWRQAVYYFVIESYRDPEDGTPRQRTVEALGRVPPEGHVRYWRSRVSETLDLADQNAAAAEAEEDAEEHARFARREAFYRREAAQAMSNVERYEALQRTLAESDKRRRREKRRQSGKS